MSASEERMIDGGFKVPTNWRHSLPVGSRKKDKGGAPSAPSAPSVAPRRKKPRPAAVRPRKKTTWTPARLAELARWRAAGVPARIYAEKLGVLPATALVAAKKYKLPPAVAPVEYKRKIWTPERLAELARLRANGMTAATCAETLGVKISSVNQASRRYGIRPVAKAKLCLPVTEA